MIEILVALIIIGVIALTTSQHILTGFNRHKARSKTYSYSASLIQAAHFARNQAITKQTYTTLTPSSENRWDKGWVVYINPELDFPELINPEVILLKHSIIESDLVTSINSQTGNQFEDVNAKSFANNERIKHITFNPAGGAQMKNGGLIANRLAFQHTQFEDIQQQIIMGTGGRLRLCSPSEENLQCRR